MLKKRDYLLFIFMIGLAAILIAIFAKTGKSTTMGERQVFIFNSIASSNWSAAKALENWAVYVTFRTGPPPTKPDDLTRETDDLSALGYDYYITAGSSDFVVYEEAPKFWDNATIEWQFLNRPHCQGVYLHEIYNWWGMNESDYTAISGFAELCEKYNKKIIWSEWGHQYYNTMAGWYGIRDNWDPYYDLLFDEYGQYIVPVWANNNPTRSNWEDALKTAKEVATEKCGFPASRSYGASIQTWYWGGFPTTLHPDLDLIDMPWDCAYNFIERSYKEGGFYAQFEGGWEYPNFINGIRKGRDYISGEIATGPITADWELGVDAFGWEDTIVESKNVEGYDSGKPPVASFRKAPDDRGVPAYVGSYYELVSGEAKEAPAYIYYKTFDYDIKITEKTGLRYWIYNYESPDNYGHICVDGVLIDGTRLRDFIDSSGNYLTDQHGVRIHPALRNDVLGRWIYVEIDLAPLAGKQLDYIMFGYGCPNKKGKYKAYIDHFYLGEMQKLPKPKPPTPPVKKKSVSRISGDDRYKTAVEISKKGWERAKTVILARGDLFPDALAGAPLSSKYNSPILLTLPKTLTSVTRDEINRLRAKEVIILGQEGAISADVLNDLNLQCGISRSDMPRLGGENRYETSVEIAVNLSKLNEAGLSAVSTQEEKYFIFTTGENFPDALSISSLAGIKKFPIILVKGSSLSKNCESALKELNINKCLIIGENDVVSDSLASWLWQNNYSYERLADHDRFGTCSKIVKFGFEKGILNLENIFLTTGDDFPDALVAAPLAIKYKAPVLITKSSILSNQILEFIKPYKTTIYSLNFVGGVDVLSETVEKQTREMIGI